MKVRTACTWSVVPSRASLFSHSPLTVRAPTAPLYKMLFVFKIIAVCSLVNETCPVAVLVNRVAMIAYSRFEVTFQDRVPIPADGFDNKQAG